MQRYSRKRQAILDCLKSTDEHPTAEWVYAHLKTEFPGLSLATVYRNLLQLKEAGLVRSMGTVLGQERFDAATHPHSHVVCTECGRIADISGISVPGETLEQARTATGFDIRYAGLTFSGLCEECRQKNGKL